MPPLPITTFAPDASNQRGIHSENRKLAVAVTPPTLKVPSGSRAAAGEQWKLALLTRAKPSGSGVPSSSTLR